MALLVVSVAASQPPDVVSQAQAALAAIAANEFTKVEQQFIDEMKAALPPGRLQCG